MAKLFPFAVLFRYDDADGYEPFDRQALHDRVQEFLAIVRQTILT